MAPPSRSFAAFKPLLNPTSVEDSEIAIETCSGCGAALDATDIEPLTQVTCPSCGTPVVVGQLLGPYELVKEMGRGGMGVVYKAVDTSLDREIALKVLRRDHSANAELIAQLETEAAITASINHPYVVRVFTTGSEQGKFYIAMELVSRGTLDDLIQLQGQVAEAQVLEVAIQIAQGLRAAYQHGLIHRDVKPGNILFADAHTAKIVDFGLATLEAAVAGGAGEIWGTPYYVAPEKLDQKPEDFRSDIYSLGATLFHALAGRPPFEAKDASMVALKHLKSQAVSLQAFAPNISGSTAYVINRTLNKDPDKRYQSYDELIEHLEYARRELLEKGAQPVAKKRVVIETTAEQKLWGYITFGMLGLAIIAGAGGWWYMKNRNKEEQPAASAAALSAGAASGSRQAGEYEAARQELLSGNFSGAADSFAALGTERSTPAPLVQWAILHKGLSELVDNDLVEARTAFNVLAQRPFTADKELGAFFQKLSRLASTDQPVPPQELDGLRQDNYNLMAFLVLGLKNWALGDIEGGAALLRKFQSASPGGDYAWLAEYRKLTDDYLSDYKVYQTAAAAVRAANSPAEQAKALIEITRLRGSVKTRGKVIQELDKMIPELQAVIARSRSAPAQANASEPAPKLDPNGRAAELKTLEAARGKAADLARQWKFKEAQQEIAQLTLISAEATTQRYTLEQKLAWLAAFKESLIQDLGKGRKIQVGKKSAADPKLSVTSASEAEVQVSGTGSVPWPDLAPVDLVNQAATLIPKDLPPDVRAERWWVVGVYAAWEGLPDHARQLLTAAASRDSRYLDVLPSVWPGLKMSAENLARSSGVKSADSGTAQPNEGPEKAFDNDTKTRWNVDASGPKWLAVDLGKDLVLTHWVVKHARSGGDPAELNLESFNLQVSTNGKDWRDVDKVSGNRADVTRRSILPVVARHARLFIPSGSRSPGDNSARVPEFEIYGGEQSGSSEILELGGAQFVTCDAMDIGITPQQPAGSTEYNPKTGLWRISAGGTDLYDVTDGFHFVHQRLRGDGELIARVAVGENSDRWTKFGLMVRTSLAADSSNVFVGVSGSMGAVLQSRSENRAKTNVEKSPAPPEAWLKLTRKGDEFSGYHSADGREWKQIGGPTVVKAGENPYVGIAFTAHMPEGAATGAFHSLHVRAADRR